MTQHWQDRLLEVLEPVYKPTFDGRRAERVYRSFDERRGFRRYCQSCRTAFARNADAYPRTPLTTEGLLHLDVLPPEASAEFLTALETRCSTGIVKTGRRPLTGLHLDDPVLRDELLEAVLSGEVDRHLIGFFGSEYCVLWMTATVTPPVGPPNVSFRWHCDKGPRAHLKLIVYLNATADHGGNTEFVPLRDSAAVAARGYVFGRVSRRTGDLAELTAVAGRPLTAIRREMTAGGGVIFRPAEVLHRGITPSRGSRCAITLCLLPSPVHWREALARGALSDLSVDPKWPNHADDLLQRLHVTTDER